MPQMARPPGKRKFLLRSCLSAALRGAKAVLAILHYQTRTATCPKSSESAPQSSIVNAREELPKHCLGGGFVLL
jgi:hypothetical protein